METDIPPQPKGDSPTVDEVSLGDVHDASGSAESRQETEQHGLLSVAKNGKIASGWNAQDQQLSLAQLLSIQALTPARIFAGSAGTGYRTETQLRLRGDHAGAIDAVRAELDVSADFPAEFVTHRALFEIQTQARSKEEYLLRPDLGRRLNGPSRIRLSELCPRQADLQIVIGDGLSVAAVRSQAVPLFFALEQQAAHLGWQIGHLFVIRYCRVGVMNEIGELLEPTVVVLLIGERPGLATAESLSAYLAYRPQPGHTDANRNLISNIHDRGVSIQDASHRIIRLAMTMRHLNRSGYDVKETLAVDPFIRDRESTASGITADDNSDS